MALSASVLASLIQSNLESQGANGSNLKIFCSSIASGITMSIVGVAFVTADVGLVAGVGAGIGTGITGLVSSNMVSSALNQMSSQGSNAKPLMQAIMGAVVTELGNATLTTVDVPVFLGTGIVNVGSIAVIESAMASNISTQLQSSGAKGANISNLSKAIATGICSQILSSGTGTVVITGSPTVPTPVSGTGVGTGIIS